MVDEWEWFSIVDPTFRNGGEEKYYGCCRWSKAEKINEVRSIWIWFHSVW